MIYIMEIADPPVGYSRIDGSEASELIAQIQTRVRYDRE
jgi:hypothetical protein